MRIKVLVLCNDCEVENTPNCPECRKLGVDTVRLYKIGKAICRTIRNFQFEAPVEFEQEKEKEQEDDYENDTF